MLLLLVLACATDPKDSGVWPPPQDSGDPAGDPGPEGHDYTSFEGTLRFQSGWSDDVQARACDLSWASLGTPRDLCDDCIWSFDVTLAYEPDLSIDNDDCFVDEDGADFTWGLGLSLDWYDYGVPVLWYYISYYEYWYPQWVADWSYPDVLFGGGTYEGAYAYEGGTWYYTSYWSGTAEVR